MVDWEGRWRAGDTPWDLGRAPPVLLASLREEPFAQGPQRVLVPGSGGGWDAIALALAGHDVVALDLAPAAHEVGRARAAAQGATLEWATADLLALPAALRGAFDAIWEQTCFCALEPALRNAYADAVAGALRPGGWWVGLLWEHGKEGGPPYSVSEDVLSLHFARHFDVVAVRSVHPPLALREREWLATLRLRAAARQSPPAGRPTSG